MNAPEELALRVLRTVLGPGARLDPHTPLLTLAGFDSMAIAAVVELLETELGRSVPDEWIVPDAFETPASLAALVVAPALEGATDVHR